VSSIVGLLTENEGDDSAFPWTQYHEGVRQPLHERGVLEVVVAVVGVAVNWRGAHVLCVLQRGVDGHDVDPSVVRDRRKGHGCDVSDGRMSFDFLETEQLPEAVRDVYSGVAWAATSLGGRNDLDAIQAIFATNGGSGGIVEVFAGRADLITGGDYGNSEGYRIHAGCRDFCERQKGKKMDNKPKPAPANASTRGYNFMFRARWWSERR
jgi:hypothetical protein